MLHGYVKYQQQHWDEYASTSTKVYSSQIHGFTNTHPFDLVLGRRSPDFTLNVQFLQGKLPTVAKSWSAFLATLQLALYLARNSLQRPQERNKRDFDWCLYKSRERLRTQDYVFIEKLDGVAKAKYLGHALKGIIDGRVRLNTRCPFDVWSCF